MLEGDRRVERVRLQGEKGGGGGQGSSERGGLMGTVREVRQTDSGIVRDSETDSQSERELGRERS